MKRTILTKSQKNIGEHDIFYSLKQPTPELFIEFRKNCGWGIVSIKSAEIALKNSLYFISAEFDHQIVGFGRVVGDGALNYYIQDLIVDPKFRGHSIGSMILTKLIDCIKRDSASGATIGLMAAVGKEEFYLKHGFKLRPDRDYGAGMTMVI